MALILSDAGSHRKLLPLTFTRPVGALRPAILTIAEAWWRMTELPIGYRTEQYLAPKFPVVEAGLLREVRGGLLPLPDLVSAVLDLEPGNALMKDGRVLAYCAGSHGHIAEQEWNAPPVYLKRIEFTGETVELERPWHVFQHCGRALINDHALITEGRRTATLSALNTVIGDPSRIFLEDGAQVEASILNTTNGPIYIGKNAEVMEGCMIRGPFALGEHAQLKMGAKVYGPTAIGPHCRVGGEVNNSVFLGHSNKGHDGFVGNSVIGAWCNLGADTNTSNLKNTYGEVAVWDHEQGELVSTGLTFCGLIMGDHCRTGINTMLNTGTVMDVAVNVFGDGFPPKYMPAFSWGGAAKLEEYRLDQVLVSAERMMARRDVALHAHDREILTHIFQTTAAARHAELPT